MLIHKMLDIHHRKCNECVCVETVGVWEGERQLIIDTGELFQEHIVPIPNPMPL